MIDKELENMYHRITKQLEGDDAPDPAETLHLIEELFAEADEVNWQLKKREVRIAELEGYITDWEH